MPIMHLVGAAQHREGRHTLHVPKLHPETGQPATGADKGTQQVHFYDGKADIDNAGIVKWLQEQKYATPDTMVEAYGLQRPGKGPVLAFDDAGVATEVQPAKPIDLKPATPEAPATGKK